MQEMDCVYPTPAGRSPSSDEDAAANGETDCEGRNRPFEAGGGGPRPTAQTGVLIAALGLGIFRGGVLQLIPPSGAGASSQIVAHAGMFARWWVACVLALPVVGLLVDSMVPPAAWRWVAGGGAALGLVAWLAAVDVGPGWGLVVALQAAIFASAAVVAVTSGGMLLSRAQRAGRAYLAAVAAALGIMAVPLLWVMEQPGAATGSTVAMGWLLSPPGLLVMAFVALNMWLRDPCESGIKAAIRVPLGMGMRAWEQALGFWHVCAGWALLTLSLALAGPAGDLPPVRTGDSGDMAMWMLGGAAVSVLAASVSYTAARRAVEPERLAVAAGVLVAVALTASHWCPWGWHVAMVIRFIAYCWSLLTVMELAVSGTPVLYPCAAFGALYALGYACGQLPPISPVLLGGTAFSAYLSDVVALLAVVLGVAALRRAAYLERTNCSACSVTRTEEQQAIPMMPGAGWRR